MHREGLYIYRSDKANQPTTVLLHLVECFIKVHLNKKDLRGMFGKHGKGAYFSIRNERLSKKWYFRTKTETELLAWLSILQGKIGIDR